MIVRKRRTAAPRVLTRLVSILLPIAVLLPAPAWAYQELVVVRKNGRTSTYVSQSKVAGANGAVCADDSVAFAFTVEPREGVSTVELQRGVDVSRDFVLDVTLTCSTLQGSALVPFDALAGTAVSGTDYLSTPGVAMLNLTGAQGGTAAPVAATVRVELLGSGQSGTQTLSIVRTEGSFQGSSANGSPVVGTIPGSNAPIIAITILGQATIEEGAGIPAGDRSGRRRDQLGDDAFLPGGRRRIRFRGLRCHAGRCRPHRQSGDASRRTPGRQRRP